MDRSLVGTKICTVCVHEVSACTCEEGTQKIINYESYAEEKWHASLHQHNPSDCYKPYIK
jgi:hypothetical protein